MTELERAFRQQRWVTLFWLCVSLGDLGLCLWTVVAFAPRVAFSARGVVLVVLSVFYAAWMIWTFTTSWRACRARPYLRAVVWAVLFAVSLALFAVSPLMGWLCYAVFGMAFSMFDLPWAIPASLAAYVMIPITVLANGYAPPSTATNIGFWGGFALAYPIYAAMCYLPAMSMRQRIRREEHVAEMERMHRELEVAHRQLADSAEGERELAVLRERSRLARDMHDTLGHALVLASVKLEAAQRLRGVDAARADHEVAVTQQIVREAMSELRATLAALRTPLLPDQGIGEILANALRDTAQRTGWQTTCNVASDLCALDERTREALLRIGLEAFANVERHARARTVTLTLARTDDDCVALDIADDGVGLDLYVAHSADSGRGSGDDGQAPPGHYGLTGMRERAATLGGTLRVYSPATGGTVVSARLPLVAALDAPAPPATLPAGAESGILQPAERQIARR